MANTLSVMTNVLRNVVSKQRIRYKEGGYNLDLAYICDNIIAMGYPADKIESIYRNRLEDVYKFLEDYHRDHYKIYNLCLERSYDINKFHKRVGVFPFEDHNPPSIELIQTFCRDVDQWLKEDSNNVAAVHCKAGKGRTGTMICCYLLYSGQQSSAEGALTFYDEKRTKDRKGVTIPSQRRYVQYFSTLVRSGVSYVPRTLKLCEIRFGEASHLQSQGVVNCTISRFQDNSSIITTLCNICIDFRKTTSLDLTDLDLLVAGDIKVEISHKTSRKSYFHFWINTYFVCSTDETDSQLVYTLNKGEIDDIHKDKEHKLFSEDFKVQLVFFNVTETPKESNYAESCQLVEKEVELFQNEGCADAATNGKSLLHDILDCENLRNTSFSATNNIFYKKSEQASNTISESFQPSALNDATTVYETHKEERHTKNVILKKPKIHRNTASHHINELSEKIGKTSICDENNDLRISNSHIHQLQIIRNKCNISSVCSNNTLSIGDDNIEQDRECGESADNQLQQNVLLPSVAPSSSVNSSSLDFFFENDNTSNLSRTLTNTENGFAGCSKNRIEELTKREEKSDIKTKFSNLHLCNVDREMATNKLQTFKHELLEPTSISKKRIGFFFIKRISNKVQNKYFKHKNFVSYANANMFQSRPSTIASGSKCSRVKSSKHTYKIKLKLKNQRSKAISDVKIKQSSHILKLNDSDYFTFLNNDMLLKSCPSKHISFKEMYGTPSCTHPVRHSEEFKTISNVGSLPCSEDFYSSICDKQLISKSSLCESAQRLQCMSLNFSSCDNVENVNANVSCKLLKPVSMPEHVDSHERENENEHSIIKKISNEENVTKTP